MTWQIDQQHTHIGFSALHFSIIPVKGKFTEFTGTLTPDEGDLTRSGIVVVIDANSIESGNYQRDVHLRSADFLNVERFPTITFRSTRIEPVDPFNLRLVGDLTIIGVTREIVLDVEILGLQAGNHRHYEAHGRIDRRDWGMTWAKVPGLAGDMIDIDLQFAAVRRAETVDQPVSLTQL
jgi:polyisoprenoid-binding protein YceI